MFIMKECIRKATVGYGTCQVDEVNTQPLPITIPQMSCIYHYNHTSSMSSIPIRIPFICQVDEVTIQPLPITIPQKSCIYTITTTLHQCPPYQLGSHSHVLWLYLETFTLCSKVISLVQRVTGWFHQANHITKRQFLLGKTKFKYQQKTFYDDTNLTYTTIP